MERLTKLLGSIIANISLLLLAFVLSLFIWGTAVRTNDPIEKTTFRVPIDMQGIPVNGELVEDGVDTVLVEVEGPQSYLNSLRLSDFSANVDLASAPFGDNTLPINILLDNDQVTIDSVIPETTDISLEQIISIDIPIDLVIRGDAALGYALGEPIMNPTTVQVTGIESRVEEIKEARVNVFLEDAREDIELASRVVTFYKGDGTVSSPVGLNSSTTEVAITIPILQLADFAEKNISITLDGEPALGYRLLGFSVEPRTALVTGAPSRLNDFFVVPTDPIDITGLREPIELEVALQLPEGVDLQQDQDIAKVSINIAPVLTTSLLQRVPQARGLTENLRIENSLQPMRLVLAGPFPILNALTEEDARVTLDLSGLGVGTHAVEPAVSLPPDLELRDIQPPIISVTITEVRQSIFEIEDFN